MNVIFADTKGKSANLTNVKLKNIQITQKYITNPKHGFLELSTVEGIETVDFGDPIFLMQYLEDAFEYAHREDIEEKKEFPDFVTAAITKMKLLRQLFIAKQKFPQEIIQVVKTISVELIKHLKNHPKVLYKLKPRQFEELIAEILATFGWQVRITQATRDNGYDIYAIEKTVSEDRWISIGKIKNHGIIVVVHTERIKGEQESIRIISARKADISEEKEYIKRIGGI